jgi:hypothetical protein
MRRYELWGTIAVPAVRWLGIVGILFFCYKIASALAGHYTFAQIGLGFLADIRTTNGIIKAACVLLGGSGFGYGYKQRQLRRKEISAVSHRNRELEKRIDPRRTSSNLTEQGTTRPEDQP